MKFKRKTTKKPGGSASSNPTTMKHRNKITTSKSAVKVGRLMVATNHHLATCAASLCLGRGGEEEGQDIGEPLRGRRANPAPTSDPHLSFRVAHV